MASRCSAFLVSRFILPRISSARVRYCSTKEQGGGNAILQSEGSEEESQGQSVDRYDWTDYMYSSNPLSPPPHDHDPRTL